MIKFKNIDTTDIYTVKLLPMTPHQELMELNWVLEDCGIKIDYYRNLAEEVREARNKLLDELTSKS